MLISSNSLHYWLHIQRFEQMVIAAFLRCSPPVSTATLKSLCSFFASFSLCPGTPAQQP
jgi:hypothetical protein